MKNIQEVIQPFKRLDCTLQYLPCFENTDEAEPVSGKDFAIHLYLILFQRQNMRKYRMPYGDQATLSSVNKHKREK